MSRIARVVLPGHPHHVTQRGVRSMNVFRHDKDKLLYLELMHEQCARFGVDILSYCLMDNHVHLVAVPKTEQSLAKGIGEAHRRYTVRLNRNEGVTGYLFQGRFYSCPLDERHCVAAVRYIERNPVRAGMVKLAWDCPWSSAAYRVAAAESNPLVRDRHLPGLAIDWKELLAYDPEEIFALRKHVRTGRPCGDEKFLLRAEALTDRPLRARRVGRP